MARMRVDVSLIIPFFSLNFTLFPLILMPYSHNVMSSRLGWVDICSSRVFLGILVRLLGHLGVRPSREITFPSWGSRRMRKYLRYM